MSHAREDHEHAWTPRGCDGAIGRLPGGLLPGKMAVRGVVAL